MRKQIAIIQLKEKTTLLAQARERIAELEGQVVRLAQLEEHARQQQAALDLQSDLIKRQKEAIENAKELAKHWTEIYA